MIKAIVFDVDGTLMDNVDALSKGWKLFAKKLNLKPPSKKMVKDFLGIPYYEIAPQMWPGFNPYEHEEEFKKCVAHFAKEMKPVIDRTFVKNLKKKYKIGIVSSARRKNLENYIGDIIDLFDVVIGAEDTERHKPDPLPLIICCEKLKVPPKDTLYIGDTMFDFLCAKGAGAEFIGVLTGVGTRSYFKKLNSPYIKSVKEVGKYLVKLNG